MKRADLAKRLISAADSRDRRSLLLQNPKLTDEKLADEIRAACYATWTSEPKKARRAAAVMKMLVKSNNSSEIRAIAFWVDGISNITKGRFEQAAVLLKRAAGILTKLGRKTDAAQARVAELLALAMLGRYGEAIRTGRSALKVLVANRDVLAAGKIELNLSNICSRRSQHAEAVKYCAAARRRFIKAGETSWQAMAENGLANSYMELGQFNKAEQYYKAALEKSRDLKMQVTEAEIEASLGNLALLRGDYRAALRSLELSRQRYSELDMPHQSTIADVEIADIYAELNLVAEAIEIYQRSAAAFSKLRLRGEEARARLSLGRMLAKTADIRGARLSLTKAEKLFEREKNISGCVTTLLSLAEAEIELGESDRSRSVLNLVKRLLSADENPRSVVRLELLRGIDKFVAGRAGDAKKHLVSAINLAKKGHHPEAVRIGETWLGRAFAKIGETSSAARHFRRAIEIVERQRRDLTSEEFSRSFSATRLDAYAELGKLLLSQNLTGRAFEVFEKSRSRSLLDGRSANRGRSSITKKLASRVFTARAELNVLYREADTSTPDEQHKFRVRIANAERSLANLDRQINSVTTSSRRDRNLKNPDFSLSALQSAIGGRTSLIEYVSIDGQIGAFVVTSDHIRYVPAVATESEISELLERLHFQLDTVRYPSAHLARFAAQLKANVDGVLGQLYDKLFSKIAGYTHGDRLLIVPAGAVHYVPFCALYDGSRYLAERFEIRHSPSAAVWRQLFSRRRRKLRKALLLGFADERIPLVQDEIEAISGVMPSATNLTGESATYSAFLTHSAGKDLLHIACHGQFRPDSPMFSSLHLADGWITVRDLVAGRISAELVTLSACETGISKVFAGEEILGLARGFLSAGARSLIVSLWAVNDKAATDMMPLLYEKINDGIAPAEALRQVQLAAISRDLHPALWAPFSYIGP